MDSLHLFQSWSPKMPLLNGKR